VSFHWRDMRAAVPSARAYGPESCCRSERACFARAASFARRSGRAAQYRPLALFIKVHRTDAEESIGRRALEQPVLPDLVAEDDAEAQRSKSYWPVSRRIYPVIDLKRRALPSHAG